MKSLTFNFRIALPALLCSVALAAAASAQEAAASWVRVAPPEEAFTVSMPRIPFPAAEHIKWGGLNVAGRRYSLHQDKAEYTVWSFKVASLPSEPGDDREAYLDQCAEIAWNLLIEPYWKKLEGKSRDELMKYWLAYDGTSPASDHPGRSYRLRLDERQGMTYIYAAGTHIYIVAAAGAAHESAGVAEFVKSFTLNLPVPKPPKPATTGSGGVGPGRGSSSSGNESASGIGDGSEARETDYTRTFAAREVTQKARVLAKPEPLYTEWARRFGVTGTVRMRLILRASGEVGGITLISRLPHGLTQKALEAARRIKFTPAIKDGRPVAQYITFEYNFNIY